MAVRQAVCTRSEQQLLIVDTSKSFSRLPMIDEWSMMEVPQDGTFSGELLVLTGDVPQRNERCLIPLRRLVFRQEQMNELLSLFENKT
jgi:hypothetical protein